MPALFFTAPICQVARLCLSFRFGGNAFGSAECDLSVLVIVPWSSTKPTYETLLALAPLPGIIYLISKNRI